MNRAVSARVVSLFGALCVAACAGSASHGPAISGDDATPSGSADTSTDDPVDDTPSNPDTATTRGTDDVGPLSADGGSSAEDIATEGDSGCDPSSSPPPTGPVAPAPITDEDAPTGTVAGRLVHPDGSPIEAMRMLACTASICYWDETDSDGRFQVSDLTLEPLKMQTGDPDGAHLDLLFYHLLDTEEVSELPQEIIVPLRDEQEPTPWSDEGGTVTLANGALELHAESGALTYPFGTLEEAIRAMRVEGPDLPPYDWAPWSDAVDDTFAFVINPVGLAVEPGATVRVHGVTDAPCTVYRIWSVAAKTGGMTYAGTATVIETEDGLTLVSDTDATIHEVTTLVFSPL